MKIKRLSALFVATLVSFSSILTIGFTPFASAVSGSDTCTWTGATNLNWATATNWSGCSGAAPVNGDSLVFDDTSLSTNPTLNNNISSLSVAGITFSGSNSSSHYFEITGNALTVSGTINDNTGNYTSPTLDLDLTLGANLTVNQASETLGTTFGDTALRTITTAGHTLSFTGAGATCGVNLTNAKFAGAGTVSSALGSLGIRLAQNSPAYTGSFGVTAGVLVAATSQSLGAASGVTVSGAGSLVFPISQDTTFSTPLTLGGSGVTGLGTLNVVDSYQFCQGVPPATDSHTATFSGLVTLTSNITYSGNYNAAITGTYTSNSHTVSTVSGSAGKITTPDGTVVAPVETNTVAAGDSQPSTGASAGFNQTLVLDGERGFVGVGNGGILKGNGKASDISINDGGTVSPGHSPGKLTATATLFLSNGSTYQAELMNKDTGNYDQIVVGSASDTIGNDVTLDDSPDGPTLRTVLYDGYSFKAGDSFTIIDNLSGTPVLGTFKGLPEGATFNVDGTVFKISYVGGTGNDVVLTVVSTSASVPKTPDTGFGLVAARPAVTFVATILIAGAVLVLARRTRTTASQR